MCEAQPSLSSPLPVVSVTPSRYPSPLCCPTIRPLIQRRSPRDRCPPPTSLNFRSWRQVTELDFCHTGLESLPAEFGKFESIRVLSLGMNHLTTLPPAIGALSALEELLVPQNKLQALPRSLGQLASLKTLNAAGNQLTAFPDVICELSSLATLDLANNSLVYVSPRIQRLSSTLKALCLSSNAMGAVPDDICRSRRPVGA